MKKHVAVAQEATCGIPVDVGQRSGSLYNKSAYSIIRRSAARRSPDCRDKLQHHP